MKYVYSNEWGLFPSLGATLRLQKRTTQSTTSRDGLESTAISKENADRQKQATPSLMCLKFNLRQRSSQCSARRKWRRKHARSTGSGEDMSKLSTLLTCQLGHRPSTAMCCTFHLDFSPKDPTDFDDRLSGFGCSVNAERVEHVEMNGLKSVNNTAEMNFQPRYSCYRAFSFIPMKLLSSDCVASNFFLKDVGSIEMSFSHPSIQPAQTAPAAHPTERGVIGISTTVTVCSKFVRFD
ncbi:hypothetical protein BLNAU_23536 [Blattamonas nauphoetae]|uniref:Uncharacterized protein n=1 Tax=Blattamonas nauphoetae TaxID=2049346 RepID=A0ABQ9WPZ0_9EUKA|nr:hypothetical protein BLNAU_23536 [Blattamonas nauphoetae]